jgi:cullin 3
MDRKDAQETYEVLANAIDQIYKRNASQLSFEELYRNAYNLVLHKHGAFLYEGVSDKMNAHLLTTVQELQGSTCLLTTMANTWQDHQMTVCMIRDILMYMDRTFVAQQKRRPVYDMGLHLFRVTVYDHYTIQPRVTQLVLDAIRDERDQSETTLDRTKLRSIIRMLLELQQTDASSNTYLDLESELLGSTQEYYHQESLSYLSNHTAMDYVWKAALRLKEEKERAQTLTLPQRTETALLGIVETEWIERHAKTLVDMDRCGFKVLMNEENDKLNDMKDMYDLFVRVPSSVDYLRDALSERVKKDGRELISDQEKGVSPPSTFVKGVLGMRDKYELIVQVSFRNEKRAQKRMREAFEDFLNMDARAASCLAVYVNELLTTALRGATEEQVNTELEKSIVVFRFLQDKDVFENYYKGHLAKRLLSGRSISDDAERQMVSLLKAECGYQFTTKLEGMFNDMRISRETRDSYKSYKRDFETDEAFKIDIEVDVLTTGYWPSQQVPSCTLPMTAQEAIDRFSKFYLEKHTGRKLSWQTAAGSAEIKATFGSGRDIRRHELCVSTYQMCILMLFNEHDTLTLGQIRAHTHIPDQELRRQLVSLCTPRNRILQKGSKGRGITSDDDTFAFNPDYTSKMKRVKIPLVKESCVGRPNEGGEANAVDAYGTQGDGGNMIDGSVPVSVEEDRRHLVEASIVRIMKARKSLNHNNLVAEVTKQLSIRFNPSPVFIKKRIESLIEREYLERCPNEHRLYKYIA